MLSTGCTTDHLGLEGAGWQQEGLELGPARVVVRKTEDDFWWLSLGEERKKARERKKDSVREACSEIATWQEDGRWRDLTGGLLGFDQS